MPRVCFILIAVLLVAIGYYAVRPRHAVIEAAPAAAIKIMEPDPQATLVALVKQVRGLETRRAELEAQIAQFRVSRQLLEARGVPADAEAAVDLLMRGQTMEADRNRVIAQIADVSRVESALREVQSRDAEDSSMADSQTLVDARRLLRRAAGGASDAIPDRLWGVAAGGQK